MVDLLVAEAGGLEALAARPRAVFDACSSPPLLWSELTCQNLIDCARYGIPVQLVPMPLAGSTAPVTLVGAAVQHTAETMSGVTIHQLAAPGAPVLCVEARRPSPTCDTVPHLWGPSRPL